MPTGTCNYPHHHHGPSAGPPAGFLAALAAGALIVAEWRTVLVVLAVCAVLAVLGVCVALLVHSHRAAPYDASWAEPEDAAYSAEVTQGNPWEAHARTAALAAENAALRAELAARQLEAPQQHLHLHLHGVTAEDLAAIVAQQRAIGDYQATTAPPVNPDHD